MPGDALRARVKMSSVYTAVRATWRILTERISNIFFWAFSRLKAHIQKGHQKGNITGDEAAERRCATKRTQRAEIGWVHCGTSRELSQVCCGGVLLLMIRWGCPGEQDWLCSALPQSEEGRDLAALALLFHTCRVEIKKPASQSTAKLGT